MAQGDTVLRVVTPQDLANMDRAREQEGSEEIEPKPGLLSFLDDQWYTMRNYRSSERINERLLAANRSYKGVYDPQDLIEIQKFGGSQVYAQIISTKCRGITAQLRDIYLGPERPWEIAPTPEPDLPGDIQAAIGQLLLAEISTLKDAGQPITEEMTDARYQQLLDQAHKAARRASKNEARDQGNYIHDLMVEGDFLNAFAQFLIDIPIYPYACLKGPEVHMVDDVRWGSDGQPEKVRTARLCLRRVSPFDLYWTPGVSNIAEANVIERHRLMRGAIQDLMDLPGYDKEALRDILANSEGVYTRWWDETDSQRARQEDKEQPPRNESDMIDMMEYQGSARGDHLQAYGVDVPDPGLDYHVTLYRISQHIVKATLNPNPRKRHNYYVTSFQEMPGSTIGMGLPDLIRDIEKVCNATLRSLVNNLSIASGPQVVIDDTRFVEGDEGDQLYPWRRWHYASEPYETNSRREAPIDFFQPQSNANELLSVYERFTRIADEVSAFPRYMQGDERVGGAGRTASGLAMMMQNANTILQQVAGNIDRDVLTPLLKAMHDLIMLTGANERFKGDENIRVLGVAVAAQKETVRMRQLEFLQLTANPVDAQIIGLEGRAKVLSEVANNLGFDGSEIVPDPRDAAAALQDPNDPTKQLMAQGQEGNVAGQMPRPGSQPQRGLPRENAVPNNAGR